MRRRWSVTCAWAALLRWTGWVLWSLNMVAEMKSKWLCDAHSAHTSCVDWLLHACASTHAGKVSAAGCYSQNYLYTWSLPLIMMIMIFSFSNNIPEMQRKALHLIAPSNWPVHLSINTSSHGYWKHSASPVCQWRASSGLVTNETHSTDWIASKWACQLRFLTEY